MKIAKEIVNNIESRILGSETGKTIQECKNISAIEIKQYARQACKEQRRSCGAAYIMQKGHDPDENLDAIINAPEPELE